MPIMIWDFLLPVVRQKFKPISKPIESKRKRPDLSGLSALRSFKNQYAAHFLLLLCSARTSVTSSDTPALTHTSAPEALLFSASGCSGVYPCLAVFACAFASPGWARQDTRLYLCSQ